MLQVSSLPLGSLEFWIGVGERGRERGRAATWALLVAIRLWVPWAFFRSRGFCLGLKKVERERERGEKSSIFVGLSEVSGGFWMAGIIV
jgi:hypothetical protein